MFAILKMSARHVLRKKERRKRVTQKPLKVGGQAGRADGTARVLRNKDRIKRTQAGVFPVLRGKGVGRATRGGFRRAYRDVYGMNACFPAPVVAHVKTSGRE